MSTLDDILTRLDHLEALVNAAGEATQPNYLTLDTATGLIGAEFPGGIRIPQVPHSGISAPRDSAVSFIRQSDGAVIAQLFSEEFGGTDSLVLQTTQAAIPGDTSNRREYDLNAQSPDGTASVNITGVAENAGGGNGAIIAAQASMGATFANPIIINAQGKSSFLQLLVAQKLQAQLFTFTINGLAAGVSVPTAGVNFPTPFPTSAIGMVATVQTGTANNSGLYVTSCIPTALGTFAIDITNPALQNVTCAAIAWGT